MHFDSEDIKTASGYESKTNTLLINKAWSSLVSAESVIQIHARGEDKFLKGESDVTCHDFYSSERKGK